MQKREDVCGARVNVCRCVYACTCLRCEDACGRAQMHVNACESVLARGDVRADACTRVQVCGCPCHSKDPEPPLPRGCTSPAWVLETASQPQTRPSGASGCAEPSARGRGTIVTIVTITTHSACSPSTWGKQQLRKKGKGHREGLRLWLTGSRDLSPQGLGSTILEVLGGRQAMCPGEGAPRVPG